MTGSIRRAGVWAFGAGVVAGVAWWPIVPIGVCTLIGVVLVRPRLAARRRRDSIADALPDVIDLILVAVSAGSTITGALELLEDRGPPVIREPFTALLGRLRAGETLSETLRHLADEAGPDYLPLSLVLTQAEREGAQLSSLLQRLADEAGTARRRRIEAAARRLPVQLLLPLICCSLPAVLVGAVAPLVIVSLRRL